MWVTRLKKGKKEMETNEIKRGEIFYFSNGNFTGSEEGKDRPGIVVSNDLNNKYSNNVTVVWLTSQEKKPMPTHVDIYTSRGKSVALCENVTTVSKERIIDYFATCTKREMKEIESGLLVQLGILMNEYAAEHEKTVEYIEVPSENEKRLEAELKTYKELYNDLLDRFIERR